MNGQLQFGGLVPFTDRSTGQKVQVRVWGIYAGQGVDAHEEQAIQQWIMNALATSAAAYEGNVHELPAQGHEWGAWVSQQIAPGLAQAFQAHGQIHIQGVQIEGAAAPMSKPLSSPMNMNTPMHAPMHTPMHTPMNPAPMSGGKLELAAQALVKQLGMPQDQAYRYAQVVIDAIGGAGAMSPDAHARKHDVHAQKPVDPYAQKGAMPDPYAKQAVDPYAAKGMHDPHAKKAVDPYPQKPPPDGYGSKGGDFKKK